VPDNQYFLDQIKVCFEIICLLEEQIK